ncbi:MAG: sigma-54-dependent Fis family transcriptional regulator [Alphaproteobacteria bacterium]|nr:MAG: sigma-54-dependent Fis family transcriptional regulator [Alphaproteobacteria bacterium]
MTAYIPSLLLIEDTPSLAQLYSAYLKKEPLRLTHESTGQAALESIKKQAPDLILLDLNLPDMNGLDILRHVMEQKLPSIVIIITAHGSINIAVDAMRMGCYDFIVKPFTEHRLRVTVRNALERFRLIHILEKMRDQIGQDRYCGFIGGSPPMQVVYKTIDNAANSKATIFITGESGTGKEVCADAIHRRSGRAAAPFIALNCGAIPSNLIESEIFGHVKGAFTGAIADHAGAASRAHTGTLFLDEICEMDLNLQSKLLRFIQTGSFTKVGGSKVENVDVRFICATNRDPWVEVQQGRFREDLYYRLMVIPIDLPPLRDREEDVILIARHFLHKFAHEENKKFEDFESDVELAISHYEWPGNIRQLQNVIRNIVVLNDAPKVTKSMLPAPLNQISGDNIAPSNDPRPDIGIAALRQIQPLWRVEKDTIEEAIALCEGNIPKAANLLEVSPSTIYRKKLSWE